MNKFKSILLTAGLFATMGSAVVSCGGNEDSSSLSFVPYELTSIADGADSDSLRNIVDDFDGRWNVRLTGVFPEKLGKNDTGELRDSLCRLANIRIDENGKFQISLPPELKVLGENKENGKNAPAQGADKAPGSVLTHELSIDLLTPKFAVFRSFTYSFPEGAAHPAFSNGYLNYDIAKGKIITYKMIFTVGFEKLIKVAIYDRLEEQGIDLQVEKDEFKVSKQFRLTPEGVEFIYGIYEIAPYSDGEPTVFFDYSELASILTPAGKEMFLPEGEK